MRDPNKPKFSVVGAGGMKRRATVDLEVEIMRVLEAALPGTQIYFLTHLRDNLVKVARDYASAMQN